MYGCEHGLSPHAFSISLAFSNCIDIMLNCFGLSYSQMKADKTKKVWELYLLYPIDEASRIAFVPDKAIAHTNGYAKSQERLYISMVRCYCPLSSVLRNFARISSMKIISITPFTKMFLPNQHKISLEVLQN